MAYEFTLALQKKGKTLPQGLIISGSNAPEASRDHNLHQLDDEAFAAAVMKEYREEDSNELKQALSRNIPLLRADIQLLETYEPTPGGLLNLPLTVIAGKNDHLLEAAKVKGWIGQADTGFTLEWLPAGHDLVTAQKEKLVEIIRKVMSAKEPAENEKKEKDVKTQTMV